jgi:hypothetical protein
VDFQPTTFTIFFNGAQVMTVEDATFSSAGKTGLWTKADSVTWFDDFRITKRK